MKRERGLKFGEENQNLKWGWEEYQIVGNFIHPCIWESRIKDQHFPLVFKD